MFLERVIRMRHALLKMHVRIIRQFSRFNPTRFEEKLSFIEHKVPTSQIMRHYHLEGHKPILSILDGGEKKKLHERNVSKHMTKSKTI